MWTWTTGKNPVESMSAYRSPPEGLPGFCIFEPIQHVTDYLEWANKKLRAELEAIKG